jgi:hypothetical protein
MAHLLEIYNKTLHETTKMTPEAMQNDQEAETKYIIKKLYQHNRRRKIKDFELAKGEWVRYIVPRDPMKKNRYKVSPERYQIKGKAGNMFILMDAEGNTKSFSRWRLLPYHGPMPPDPNAVRVGKNFHTKKGKNNQGIMDHISKFRERTKGKSPQYRVVWNTTDDGEAQESWVTIDEMRKNQTDKNKETKLEKKFWDREAENGRYPPKKYGIGIRKPPKRDEEGERIKKPKKKHDLPPPMKTRARGKKKK